MPSNLTSKSSLIIYEFKDTLNNVVSNNIFTKSNLTERRLKEIIKLKYKLQPNQVTDLVFTSAMSV